MSWFTNKKVVVPVDFSDDSAWALETAVEMAGNGALVQAIHVAPVLNAAEPGVVWEVIAEETRAKHVKEEFHKHYGGERFKDVKISVTFGDPGTETADFAKQVGAALIVMPSHGRTGLSRLLIGSVAERVVRLAHCPVLVLRH